MNVTFNQIITEFNNFATKHKGISSFESKLLTEFTANNYTFPLMWVQTDSIKFKDDQVLFDFKVTFVSLLRNKDNENKILSDTLKLCSDFFSYYNDDEELYGFLMSDEAPAKQVLYKFDDSVIGNEILVTIEVKNERDSNQVPI